MIEEQVQMIKVEPAIIARTENLARKTYKVSNWIKLISMLLENQNHDEIDNLVRTEIHDNFVMQQGFWKQELKRKFNKPVLTHDDIELLLLSLEDGPYFNTAGQISIRMVDEFKKEKKTLNYTISVLQRIAARFSHNPLVGSIFIKSIRNVYELVGNVAKIRQCYEREIKGNFDNIDIAFDSYKLWQKQPELIERMRHLYEQSKKRWQAQKIAFDQSKLSKLNIRESLHNIQAQHVVDQNQYIQWINYLPNQTEKLQFLRRAALWHRKLIDQYLAKCQQYYQADQDKIITKYKVGIRLSQHNQNIQEKYIGFLVRRISKHLIQNGKQIQKEYYDQWGDKVAFFREEINSLISKQRKFNNETDQKKLFNQYYKIWIEVEQNIVKDKDMVCKLYENLVKDRKELEELEEYRAYARSMVQMNAFKDAKNVLRRYMLHCSNSEESKSVYQRFINIYGTTSDRVEFLNEERAQKNKKAEIVQASNIVPAVSVVVQQEIKAEVNNEARNGVQPQQTKSLKRERNKELDEVQEKIESSLRKKVHVDGQNTVFMKGIPSDWTQTDVLKALKLQNRVVSVRLVVKNSIQKDYCYIEFDSKQSAEQQIQINQSGYKLFISRPPADYDQTKTLFLCALPPSATYDKISNLFSNHSHNILQIRLKLQKDKNYAYVDFNSKENKQLAFNQLHNQNLIIDGKKILMQHCDSNRQKNRKFAQVVFLKGLAFKTQNQHIQEFFKNMKISNISIPRTNQGRGKGFGYVEFQKFKDYQEALDMRKGTILGREFQILKSDRQITQSNPQRQDQRQRSNDSKPNPHPRKPRNNPKENQNKPQVAKDNNYFSSLFK